MNAYDFDGTIYDGDASIDFFKFCLKKQKRIILCFFKQFFGLIAYLIGLFDKKKFKQSFFCFLKQIKDIDGLVMLFWKRNINKLKAWYLEQQKEDDVIISASPYFLLKPICDQIGIKNLIASNVNKETGKFESENCYGNEKVKRFKQERMDCRIAEFYSDSLSDSPLAEIAEKAFFVSKEKIVPWSAYRSSFAKKIKMYFFTQQFFLFLLIGTINALNGILFAVLISYFVMNANLSFVLGYLISLTISYCLNSFLVFKSKLHIVRLIKFCISYIPNFIIQNVCVLIFYNYFGLTQLLAFAISALIGVPITFILLKIYAYKKSAKQST